jgi:hypothetical protein
MIQKIPMVFVIDIAEDFYSHEYPEEEDSDQIFEDSEEENISSEDDSEYY